MSDLAPEAAAIDPKRFREVLGQYPTGVCVITAMQPSGPVGMVVGSFTSVSLDPPLVAFFPDRNSGTWARLSRSARFCVNILSADQEPVCRTLASKAPDKFAGLAFGLSRNGSPLLEGVVAWIDCDLHSVSEAGDHFIVLGQVRALEIGEGGLPLLFFQGGYGRFAPSSLMASDTHGFVTEQLRIVDLARVEMERIAAGSDGQCIASIRLGDELIIAASAGQGSDHAHGVPVGDRLPFVAPFGSSFAAWLGDEQIGRWIGASASAARRQAYRAALAVVRERGFATAMLRGGDLEALATRLEPGSGGWASGDAGDRSLADLAFDPQDMAAEVDASVRMISTPVFDAGGNVVLTLTLQGFPAPSDNAAMHGHVARLLDGARHVAERINGRRA